MSQLTAFLAYWTNTIVGVGKKRRYKRRTPPRSHSGVSQDDGLTVERDGLRREKSTRKGKLEEVRPPAQACSPALDTLRLHAGLRQGARRQCNLYRRRTCTVEETVLRKLGLAWHRSYGAWRSILPNPPPRAKRPSHNPMGQRRHERNGRRQSTASLSCPGDLADRSMIISIHVETHDTG